MKKSFFHITTTSLCVGILIASPVLALPQSGLHALNGKNVQAVESVTLKNILRIPLATTNLTNDRDADSDGLSDGIEVAIGTKTSLPDTDGDSFNDSDEVISGYNPLKGKKARLSLDPAYTKGKLGRLLLQATSGETLAWYINPNDKKAYFLGGDTALEEIIKKSGLRVAWKDVQKKLPKKILATGVYDCGVDEKNPNAKKCFEDHFKKCEPARRIYDDLLGTGEVTILKRNNKSTPCEVSRKYLKVNVPEFAKGEIICPFIDTESTDDLARCRGPLKAVFENFISSTPAVSQDTSSAIPFTSLASGTYEGIKRGMGEVISTQEELEALWMSLYPDTATRMPTPHIDFGTKTLIIAYGKREDNVIAIQGIDRTNRSLNLQLIREGTQEKCPGVAVSQPFQIIQIEKTESAYLGGVGSIKRENTLACRTAPETAAIYTNQKYKVSLHLPDTAKYFTVTEQPGDDPNQKAQLVFSQFSKKENQSVVVFSVAVIPNEKWPIVEKAGGFARADGSVFRFNGATKISANDTYTFAQIGGEQIRTDDIGDYTFDEITAAPYTP